MVNGMLANRRTHTSLSQRRAWWTDPVRAALRGTLLVSLGACGGDSNERIAPADTTASSETAAPSADSADSAESEGVAWLLTAAGIGPVRAGMTFEQASEALGGRLEAPADSSCGYARSPAAPDGVAFMVVDGRIARVDVTGGTALTDRGVRIGDREARVDSLYRGEVETQPHKYTSGHYLIVTPDDTTKRLVFETDADTVARMRGGRLPEVLWVEGCS